MDKGIGALTHLLDVVAICLMKPMCRSLLENPWHNSSFDGSGFVRLFLPTNLDRFLFTVRAHIVWEIFLYDFCMTYW